MSSSANEVQSEKVNEELVAAAEQQEENMADAASSFVDVEIHLPSGNAISITNVYTSESLNTVKQSLVEFQDTTFYTSFQLKFRHAVDAENNIIELSEEYNQYVELAVYLSPIVKKCVLELVVENYDVKKARAHVKRTRDAIAFPPLSNGEKRGPRSAEGKTEESAVPAKKESWKSVLPSKDALMGDVQLGDFYKEALLRTGKPTETTSKKLSEVIKSITTSGWNPPPANRRMQGDLLYLEVVTATEGNVYITATPRGFYVNRSNRNHFDPTPAANPHFHHELFSTLLSFSANLRNAWSAVCDENQKHSTSAAGNSVKEANALDMIASFYAQGRSEVPSGVKSQWNVLPANTFNPESSKINAPHTYDLYRAQEDASSLYGVEDLGAPREWNDEIQSLRSLSAKDLNEKSVKAKLEYKIITEFTEACKTAVVAISDGIITPITDADPTQSDIFVYNGIFYSKAEDTKDSFKICNGDEAFRKCTGKDLQNQKLIQSLGIDGVSTVLCTIVDYKGQRYIGQSIIPGIFSQGENGATLMHGMLDKNKHITVKNSSHKLMEQVAKACFLPTRNINRKPFSHLEDASTATATAVNAETTAGREMDSLNKLLGNLELDQSSPIKVDDVDSVVPPEAETTPHIGPIEGKFLKGADGRVYALEVMRLTPRDANYVHNAEKSSGRISPETLAKTDKDMSVSYILRKELINIYAQRKIATLRQALMVEFNAAEEQFRARVAASREATKKPEAPAATTAADGTKKEEEKKEEPVLTPEEEAEREKFASEFNTRYAAITFESLGLEINPNCFLNFEVDTNAEVVKKDEAVARELAELLWDTVLPSVLKGVREGDAAPKDGDALIHMLHRTGVNVRYLGQLARLAKKEEDEDKDFLKEGKQRVHAMPEFWLEMLVVEMLARGVKHVLNGYYKNKEVSASPARSIVSLLNHLFTTLADKKNAEVAPAADGTAAASAGEGKSGKKNKGKKPATAAPAAASTSAAAAAVSEPVDNEYTGPNAAANREATLELLSHTIESRFLFNVSLNPATAATADVNLAFLHSRISLPTLLRRICQSAGLRIATRNFDFTSPTPFNVSDVCGLVPKIKSCEPDVLLPEFHEMLNSSVNMLHQGNLSLAFELAQQAYSVMNTITGVAHSHSQSASDQLTNILYQVGDVEPALQMSAKSLATAVQREGLDSHEAVSQHSQISMMYAEVRNGPAAIQHLLAAKYLLQLIGGPRHPELANLYGRLAPLYEEAGEHQLALECLAKARTLTNDLLKNCFFNTALAEYFYRRERYTEAVGYQMQTYAFLKELLPESDERLNEAKTLLETFVRKKAENEKLQIAQQQQQQANAATQQIIAEFEEEANSEKKKKNNNSKKNKSKK